MKDKTKEIEKTRNRYAAMKPCLSELGRRRWAAVEAQSYGHGGIVVVSQATGLSNKTIHKGLRELKNPSVGKAERIRKKGAGRKRITETMPEIAKALEALVEPTARGDPESPLRWTNHSTAQLAQTLTQQGYRISPRTVAGLLKDGDYSLQANKKGQEGATHVDRDDQFQYINETVKQALRQGQPSISIDTKKKENIGNYKNNGRVYAQKGKPIEVKTHDFVDKRLGKVVPYGIYDIGKNKGWVNVGISSDTAEFAVNAIRTWWFSMGRTTYPQATELVITADGGGSNGYRVKLWKLALQKFATQSKLTIHMRHFPPGTSKWNQIEHRMFSYISMNWRGKPLITRETVVNLIANTTTTKGLTITAFLDKNIYQKGKVVTQTQLDSINLTGDDFHPEWNYTIRP
jgi:hypothetical protein